MHIERLDEPFIIKYIAVFVAIILFALNFFIFQVDDIKKEYRTANVWMKKTHEKDGVKKDKRININWTFPINYVYENEQYLHYFNELGETTFLTNLTDNQMISAGRSNFALYYKMGVRKHEREVIYFNSSGVKLWVKEDIAKYPNLSPSGKMIAFHSSDNMTFILSDSDKNDLTPIMQAGDLITAYDFAEDTGDFSAGYINGYLLSCLRTGKRAFRMPMLTSRINVIKSVALSEKGSFIATIHGIDPEILSVYNSEGSLQWYRQLPFSRRHHVSMQISEKHKLLVFLKPYSVGIHDLTTGRIIYNFRFDEFGIEYPSYMKSDIYENKVLASLSKEGESFVFLLDINKKRIMWKNSYDEWMYNAVFSDSGDELLLVARDQIYSYARVEL